MLCPFFSYWVGAFPLALQRGDHQPRYRKNSERDKRTSPTSRENRRPMRPIWPKSSCSMSQPCLRCRLEETSSFAIKASQTPYPRAIGRRFSAHRVSLSPPSRHQVFLFSGTIGERRPPTHMEKNGQSDKSWWRQHNETTTKRGATIFMPIFPTRRRHLATNSCRSPVPLERGDHQLYWKRMGGRARERTPSPKIAADVPWVDPARGPDHPWMV